MLEPLENRVLLDAAGWEDPMAACSESFAEPNDGDPMCQDESVAEANNQPVAEDDHVIGLEGQPLTISFDFVRENDRPDPEEADQTLTVFLADLSGERVEPDEFGEVTTVSAFGGTVTVADESFVYQPPPHFNERDDIDYFLYEIADDDGETPHPLSATATVSITLKERNDPPEPADNLIDSGPVEGVPFTIAAATLIANDQPGPVPNEDNQTLTVIGVEALPLPDGSLPWPDGGGTVELICDTIVYTPAQNFNGEFQFTYVVQDDGQSYVFDDEGEIVVIDDFKTATATVTLIVAEVNDPPWVVDSLFMSGEDELAAFDIAILLENDLAGPPAALDQQGQAIAFTGVVDAEGQIAMSGSTTQGGTVDVDLDAGTILYTPLADFFGFDTFQYVVTNDGTTQGSPDPKSATATVTIAVYPVNDPPRPVDDHFETPEESLLLLFEHDLIGNDAPGPPNESDQTLTLTGVDATTARGATVSFSAGMISLDYGILVDVVGIDTFTYVVTDNGTPPLSATGTVTITITEVNDPPIANDVDLTGVLDPQVAREDSAISIGASLLTANDFPGPPTALDELATQTVTVVSVPAESSEGGTLQLSGDTIIYTPKPNFNGLDTFVYTIQDDGTTNGQPDPLEATATATVSVSEVNDPPIGVDDVVQGTEDEPLIIFASELLMNDIAGPAEEPLTQSLAVTGVRGMDPAKGTVELIGGEIHFTPAPGFNGTVTFIYDLMDDGTTVGQPDPLTASATVTIQVQPVNDPPPTFNNPPIAVDDVYSVVRGQSLVADDPFGTEGESNRRGVLANDSDPDGDLLTVALVSDVVHGTLQLNSDGTFLYTHDGGPASEDTFRYRAFDGQAFSDEATATLRIRGEFQNVDPFDVNGDGDVSPIDALLIINHLNQHGAGPLPPDYVPPPYLDVDGDGEVSPIDVSLVVNELNRLAGVAEGEASGREAATGPPETAPHAAEQFAASGRTVDPRTVFSTIEPSGFDMISSRVNRSAAVQVTDRELPLRQRVDRVFDDHATGSGSFDRISRDVIQEVARRQEWTSAADHVWKDSWSDSDFLTG